MKLAQRPARHSYAYSMMVWLSKAMTQWSDASPEDHGNAHLLPIAFLVRGCAQHGPRSSCLERIQPDATIPAT